MDTTRDEANEAMLRDIIAEGSDAISLYLNDFDGLQEEVAGDGDLIAEGEGEEAGSGNLMTVQEEEHDDGSGDRTESGQVYILVKPVLTS